MITRIVWMALTIIVAIVLLYLSRFWVFDLWGREGLFGVKELRPQGGLLSGWLRPIGLAPFELIIWVVGVFLVLTGLENLYGRLRKKS